MTKCLHCGLTLADPPNGEGESVGAAGFEPAERDAMALPDHSVELAYNRSPTPPTPAENTTPPYRAEVIDNAVLALAGGIKV